MRTKAIKRKLRANIVKIECKLYLPALFFVLIVSSLLCQTALGDELWIGGLVRWDNRKSQSISDGPMMFQDNAPWQMVKSRTNVILLGPGNIDHASDDELKRVFAYLRANKLELAIADGVLVKGPACDALNEAYGQPGALAHVLDKIRRNGGDLKYLRMDEPYFFGHKFSDSTSCHQPISLIAAEVAKSVKLIKGYFPNVRIGDGEPVDNSGRASIAELERWIEAYKDAVGEPLAFFHADMVWSDQAMRDVVPLVQFLHAKQIPFGVVYNGDDRLATGDVGWTNSAISHFVEMESGLKIKPDQAVIQSWSPLPTRMLPETRPGTLTNIAFEYIKPSTSIRFSDQGRTGRGRILDERGNSLPGAKLQIRALDVLGRLRPQIHQLMDRVPQNATSATLGIRINNEGCTAGDQPGSATVGTIQYRENGTGIVESAAPFAAKDRVASSSEFNTFRISKDQTFGPNLKKIRVTAGAEFVLSAPMAVTQTADNSGYVMLIFFDSANKPIVRKFLRFTPTTKNLGELQTDNEGRFQFMINDQIAQASPDIQIYFPGNASLRPTLFRSNLQIQNLMR